MSGVNEVIAPIHQPRPSSQPSLLEQSIDLPDLPRSRSALPEGYRHPRIFEPKPEALIGESPIFARSKSLLNSIIGGLEDAAPDTPKTMPRTPKPLTPKPQSGDSFGGMSRSPEMARPLDVTDALTYLDSVKVQFQDKPDVYNHFLDIMKDFKSQRIDTPGVIDRVSMLFHGNPVLIQGFNTFLPQGYRIDISADPLDPNTITVTTPMGTTTQSTNINHARTLRESTALGIPGMNPGTFGAGTPHPLSPFAGGSRSITPNSYHLSHGQPMFDATYSPGFQGHSTTAAASFLGNLGNKNPVEQQPPGQFNHAIQYLNKIKARYSDDPNTYKQFLEILQTYQKEQKHLQDSQVYVQVQMLFKDAPDLLNEFKNFLPDGGVVAAPNGVVGILPQPPGGPAVSSSTSWGQPEMSMAADRDKSGKKVLPPLRRKKRPTEKDTTPAPPLRVAPSRAKRAKHHHKPESPTPPYSPYQGPVASETHSRTHSHSTLQSQHPSSHHLRSAQHAHGHHNVAHSSSDELLFFDRAKKMLENRETYDEFLKLLSLFSKDIIDTKTLIELAQSFLGEGELMVELKELMGWDDKQDNVEYGPPGSIRTGPPEAMSALPADDGEGPSYRKLPTSEMTLACSGRDQLCRSVLNNEWVSHPTWATEEAGFVAHKKNSFEEVLHKSEEERHEYHVQLEALSRTIAILEPLNVRLEDMSNEERISFKLKPDLGGSSQSIYHRVIKKVYGREAGLEILQALQDCPSVAVPVVLARLKQKDDEWRRAQREWSRTWREVDAKNFYKSLDYQGISFKANDKKNITAKHFMADIEAVKAEQALARERDNVPSCSRGSLGFQLHYSFQDTSVLHDSLKLVYSFLDHSQVQYSPQERRSVEKFLRTFIPLLCMYPAVEFNAACGPLEGVPDDNESNGHDSHRSGRRSAGSTHSNGVTASDLRKKLLKTVQEKSVGKDVVMSAIESPNASPAPSNHSQNFSSSDDIDKVSSTGKGAEDIWIKEASANITTENPVDCESNLERRQFFVNTTFYTLLRLLQLLHSRLLMCKAIGAKLAARKHVSFLENPIAVELGLDDPNGPSAVLAQAIEALGDQHAEGSNVVYMYLLDACEKVFDNELDQSTFEEHMRWFFGNKAYHVFTLDKLITALVKQVQTILSDNKCQEFWYMIQNIRSLETVSNRDMIRYRREAERLVGVEDPLYRIEWVRQSKEMRIQLVGEDDPSVDGNGSTLSRWREYVDTFVMNHATEWMPTEPTEKSRPPVYMRRCLETQHTPTMESNTAIRVSLGTYRLFYEAGSEDFLLRRWGKEDGEELGERAKAKEEERRKSRFLG